MGNNPEEILAAIIEEPMTDEQSRTLELLARLDELDRMQDKATDPQLLLIIKQRKTQLRAALDNS